MPHDLNDQNFLQLEQLIHQRQLFENANPKHPYVLAKKTDINFPDINGNTLLNYAVQNGDRNVIERLLNQGAALTVSDITEALNAGNINLAEWIFDRIPDCTNLFLHNINHPIGKEWLRDKIKTALQTNVSNDQFFLNSNNTLAEIQLALRHAEMGIKKYFTQAPGQDTANKQYALDVLCIAIINHHNEIATSLFDNIPRMLQSNETIQILLGIALKSKNFGMADYLLSKGADINFRDSFGKSNLSNAIVSGEIETIDYVLSKNPILTNTDVHGRSILHMSALTKHSKIFKKISELAFPAEYRKAEDIYGHTPDYYFNITKEVTNISQSILTNRIAYFLTLNYSTPPIDLEAGVCNGLSHLIQLYAEDDKEGYFYQTIRLINEWDGTMNGLKKPFDKDLPQSKYYPNLHALLEQWTNDMIGFQLSAVPVYGLKINQKERVKQHELLGNDPGKKPNTLLSPTESYMFNREQLQEILFYYKLMPGGTRLEFGGGNHQTSSRINNEGKILYYDPNLFAEVKPYNDINAFIEMFINTKYIANNKFKPNGEVEVELDMYYFSRNANKYSNPVKHLFDESSLPHNKEEANLFQEKSPNRFTHLHLAIIGRDLPTVEKLINDGYCDINAANRFGQTPFDLAIESNFVAAARLIMQHKDFNTKCLDNPKSLNTAYNNGMKEVINDVIANPMSRNFEALFKAACSNSDAELIQRLLDTNKVILNPSSSVSPLIVAMHDNASLETIDALVRKGAKIDLKHDLAQLEVKDIMKFDSIRSPLETPLLYALNHKNNAYLSILISAADLTFDVSIVHNYNQEKLFKFLNSCMGNNTDLFCHVIRDIPLNKLDRFDVDTGLTFLHKAMLQKDIRLVEALLAKGCSVNKPLRGFMEKQHDCIEYMKLKNFPDRIIKLAEAQVMIITSNQPPTHPASKL